MRLSARTGSGQAKPTLLIALAVVLALGPRAGATDEGLATGPNDGQAPAPATAQAAAPGGEQAAAPAAEQPSGFKWNWDNTVTYGLGFRLRDQDQSIIGLAAGGTGFSVNGDDGNQNYDTGIFTNAAKINSELEFSYKGFGGFVRFYAFYDFENENGDRARTELSNKAKDRVGSRAELQQLLEMPSALRLPMPCRPRSTVWRLKLPIPWRRNFRWCWR